jgi:2-methylfumaryl-CoA hydratase
MTGKPVCTIPARPLDGYFFEDYRTGQLFRHATPRTLTGGDAALYLALTGARHVAHCSAPTAKSLGYRDTPLDDLLVFHIAFGKTVPDISCNAIANLGYADMRFLEPVYAGDTIKSETEIIGVKENSNGKSGVVYVRSTARRQDGKPVLSWVRWVMVAKRDAAASAPAKHVPDLPGHVLPEALTIPQGLKAQGLTSEDSGGEHFWEDYRAGETIDHPAGMTLDEADHTLATRLYQNTARVHFDALHMAATPFGRRLVYGGHVMSVCRALSFDGLENAICIAAINAGRHVNPVVAGDTLYAKTQVIEKWELGAPLGALRLRLLGLKNCAARDFSLPLAEAQSPPSNLVLDLDYTVLIPRRAVH